MGEAYPRNRSQILQKMGYETGKGLGKNLQGRSTIVEAQFRTCRQGFGTCGKKNSPSKIFFKSETDEKVVENFVEKFLSYFNIKITE